MRLLKSLPQIESKIENGVLPLSTLSLAQSFFRKEKIKSANKKIEILNQLECKSARAVEKILLSHSAEPRKYIPEKLRVVSENLHHLSLCIDQNLLDKIDELRALLSHKCASLSELIETLVDEGLKKHRVKPADTSAKASPAAELSPKIPTSLRFMTPPPPAMEIFKAQSRYIPSKLKQRVWQRDRGECTYIDNKTGRKCGSKHFLQYDHIEPFALGGKTSEENLRLRCAMHNRLAAVEIFGGAKMRKHVSSRQHW